MCEKLIPPVCHTCNVDEVLMAVKSNMLHWHPSGALEGQSCIKTTLPAKSPKVRSNELGAHTQQFNSKHSKNVIIFFQRS